MLFEHFCDHNTGDSFSVRSADKTSKYIYITPRNAPAKINIIYIKPLIITSNKYIYNLYRFVFLQVPPNPF